MGVLINKCTVNGRCSKGFPKEFRDHTHFGENGYPEYARPNNGATVTKGDKTYDNRHVVPYNPYLLQNSTVISMLKFVHQSKQLNTFTSTFIKVMTGQLLRFLLLRRVLAEMKSKSISTSSALA